jgi:hypothetical protein
MTDTGDNARNTADAAVMLLTLSGRGPVELLHIQKSSVAAATRLEFVKKRLQQKLSQTAPRRGGKRQAYWMDQRVMKAEIVTLEAMLVGLEAEGRYFATNPYVCIQPLPISSDYSEDTDRTTFKDRTSNQLENGREHSES